MELFLLKWGSFLRGGEELGLAGQPADVQREPRCLGAACLVPVGLDEPHHDVVFARQLAGTENKNMVVRFVEANRYDASKSKTPKLPLNINWLTCKTKFLDPVE